MNWELSWLAHRAEELRASIIQTRWYLEALQEYRHEVALIWNDSCSREISQRFLEPMATDSATAVSELEQQIFLLDACIEKLQIACVEVAKAESAASEVSAALSEVRLVFRGMESMFSEVINETTQSAADTAQARELILQANAAGA